VSGWGRSWSLSTILVCGCSVPSGIQIQAKRPHPLFADFFQGCTGYKR
jgi:hypothetical protein